MTNLLTSFFLLGQGYLEMGRKFRHGGAAFSIQQILMLLMVLGLVIIVAWLASTFYKMSSSESCNSPGKLFRDLCKAHELDGNSKRLLKMLADRNKVAQPAQVFVDEALWEPVSEDTRYQSLRERLFT